MSKVEQPPYKVIMAKGAIEVREYLSMIVAEVEVSGERKAAIKEGFGILADYIFGNNRSTEGSPLADKKGGKEKIAMTAPVMQLPCLNHWKIRFVMPFRYSIETLPQPNSPLVRLIPLPPKRYAVIRFSGLARQETLRNNMEKLREFVVGERLPIVGPPIFAFYNPPWTLPFLRRNEVMFEME
jgi:hypothetical protein